MDLLNRQANLLEEQQMKIDANFDDSSEPAANENTTDEKNAVQEMEKLEDLEQVNTINDAEEITKEVEVNEGDGEGEADNDVPSAEQKHEEEEEKKEQPE